MSRHPERCRDCGSSYGHARGCVRLPAPMPQTGLILGGRVGPVEKQPENRILLVTGMEILCERDMVLGPIVTHDFRISVEGKTPVVDVRCPCCGDVSRMEFSA